TLGPTVQVWADVFVKHATPPPGAELEQVAADTLERGGADALVVSGSATGSAPPLERPERHRQRVPIARRDVVSGAVAETLAALADLAARVIVGTSLEVDGRPGAPIDPARLDRFVAAARKVGLL